MARRMKEQQETEIEYPYKDLEGTSLWVVINEAIQDLVENQDLEENTQRRYIVGYIAALLVRNGHASSKDTASSVE